jgi:hypothetical protein
MKPAAGPLACKWKHGGDSGKKGRPAEVRPPTDVPGKCEGKIRTGNARSVGSFFLLHVRPQRFKFGFTNMSNAVKESSSANDLLKNSSLYREFQAEREEILRHKWIESEKAGRDIGFEQALTDWIIKHRSIWRKNRQAAGSR